MLRLRWNGNAGLIGLVILLLLIGMGLRGYRLGEFMVPFLNNDEKSWLFNGTSLLSEGEPASWTIFWDREGVVSRMCNTVVVPYLAHPPLFSLLIGGWANIVGETDWCDINWGLIRLPMWLISGLTLWLTFWLMLQVGGKRMAVFSLAAFTFFPSHVVASRIVAAEHFIALLMLAAMAGWQKYETIKTKKQKRLIVGLLLLVSIIAPLAKLTGLVVPGMLILTAGFRRRYRMMWSLCGAVIVMIGLYLAYNYYYGWDIFVATMRNLHGVAYTFSNFWSIFTYLNIGYLDMLDPAIIVGLIGLIVWLSQGEDHRIKVMVLASLLVLSWLFLYVAPPQLYGWYKYTLYPLIAMGLGYVFDQLWQERKIYLFLFLPWLSLTLQQSKIYEEALLLRVMMSVFYGLAIVAIWPKVKFIRFKPVFISLLLFLFLFQALWSVQVLRLMSG